MQRRQLASGTLAGAAIAASLPLAARAVSDQKTTLNLLGQLFPLNVSTIAALRAYSTTGLVSGQPFEVASYSSSSVNGGGTFVWNSAATGADDGGATINPTSNITTLTGVAMFTGTGTLKSFSGTLANTPVMPGSVTIMVGSVSVTDDMGGNFFGTGITSVNSSINYATGTWKVNYVTAPANAAAGTATYKYATNAGRYVRQVESTVNPFDFGAVGDGSTDDTTPMQQWLYSILNNKYPGYLPGHSFLVTKSLNGTAGPNNDNVLSIEGDGFNSQIIGNLTETYPILDLTDSGSCNVRNIRILANSGSANVGVFLAETKAQSGEMMYLGGVEVVMNNASADMCFVNCTCDQATYDNCTALNYAGGAFAAGKVNEFNIQSKFLANIPIAADNTMQTICGGTYIGGPNQPTLHIGFVGRVIFDGECFAAQWNGGGAGNANIVYLNAGEGATLNISGTLRTENDSGTTGICAVYLAEAGAFYQFDLVGDLNTDVAGPVFNGPGKMVNSRISVHWYGSGLWGSALGQVNNTEFNLTSYPDVPLGTPSFTNWSNIDIFGAPETDAQIVSTYQALFNQQNIKWHGGQNANSYESVSKLLVAPNTGLSWLGRQSYRVQLLQPNDGSSYVGGSGLTQISNHVLPLQIAQNNGNGWGGVTASPGVKNTLYILANAPHTSDQVEVTIDQGGAPITIFNQTFTTALMTGQIIKLEFTILGVSSTAINDAIVSASWPQTPFLVQSRPAILGGTFVGTKDINLKVSILSANSAAYLVTSIASDIE